MSLLSCDIKIYYHSVVFFTISVLKKLAKSLKYTCEGVNFMVKLQAFTLQLYWKLIPPQVYFKYSAKTFKNNNKRNNILYYINIFCLIIKIIYFQKLGRPIFKEHFSVAAFEHWSYAFHLDIPLLLFQSILNLYIYETESNFWVMLYPRLYFFSWK